MSTFSGRGFVIWVTNIMYHAVKHCQKLGHRLPSIVTTLAVDVQSAICSRYIFPNR